MQQADESTTGQGNRELTGGSELPLAIVALSLVLPRARPAGRAPERVARTLLALCPFLALAHRGGLGEPGARPAGGGPLAMPWSEPRWWHWQPAGSQAAQRQQAAPGRDGGPEPTGSQARPGARPVPERQPAPESLRLLLTLLPAVRWVERASQRPDARGAASRLRSGPLFRWAVQPPLGLLPGLSPVPPDQNEARRLSARREQDPPPLGRPPGQVWRPAGTFSASAAPPPGPGERGAARATTAEGDLAAGPAGAATRGLPAPRELPFGGALPGLAALDAVRAMPAAPLGDAGSMPTAAVRAAPGGGVVPARGDALSLPFAQSSPRAPGQARGDGGSGPGQVPSRSPASAGTGDALPWPGQRPTAPGGGPPSPGGWPEPGPYAPAAARGLAAIADAFDAAERLVESRVKAEVARATRKVQAEVDEQLRARGRETVVDLASDEALQELMHRLRALIREERFRAGRLR